MKDTDMKLEEGSILIKKEGANQTLMAIGKVSQKEYFSAILNIMNALDDFHRGALCHLISTTSDDVLVKELKNGILKTY